MTLAVLTARTIALPSEMWPGSTYRLMRCACGGTSSGGSGRLDDEEDEEVGEDKPPSSSRFARLRAIPEGEESDRE